MSSEKFWLGWLKIAIGLIILTGASLVFIAPYFTPEFLNKEINKVFFTGVIPGNPVEMMKRWKVKKQG